MAKYALLLFLISPSLLCESIPLLPSGSYHVLSGFDTDFGTPPILVDTTSSTPQSFSFSGSMSSYVIGEPATASGAITATAFPNFSSSSIDASITSLGELTNLSLLGASSTASTQFYVEAVPLVSAPSISNFIPIIITSTVSASCSGLQAGLSGYGEGFSNASVSVGGSADYYASAICIASGGSDSRTVTADMLFGVLQAVPVELSSSASFQLTTTLSTSARANSIADPTFQIDPTFPNAADYHLVYSDLGTPAPSPVPEPMYWPLIMAGGVFLRILHGKCY